MYGWTGTRNSDWDLTCPHHLPRQERKALDTVQSLTGQTDRTLENLRKGFTYCGITEVLCWLPKMVCPPPWSPWKEVAFLCMGSRSLDTGSWASKHGALKPRRVSKSTGISLLEDKHLRNLWPPVKRYLENKLIKIPIPGLGVRARQQVFYT